MDIDRIAPLKIYLAGSIRDGRHEDIEWREEFISHLGDQAIFLNPLGGKSYNPNTKKWSMSGIESSAGTIVAHDFWCVDRSDIVVFNFSALSEGYPNIGTLAEFGRATARAPRLLIYSIIGADYTGHENTTMYRLHPFLERNSAIVFPTPLECRKFLGAHLRALTGTFSRWGGEVS